MAQDCSLHVICNLVDIFLKYRIMIANTDAVALDKKSNFNISNL